MADRTAAEIFGNFFRMLAEDPEKNMLYARRVYGMTERYDFSACQMECDDTLMSLNLARSGVDEDGEDRVLYLHEDYVDKSSLDHLKSQG